LTTGLALAAVSTAAFGLAAQPLLELAQRASVLGT
jgi:hypothetical protein